MYSILHSPAEAAGGYDLRESARLSDGQSRFGAALEVEQRRLFTITGVVQGVGFRPFVHRLAGELGLQGFVGNDALAVFAEVQGRAGAVAEFERRLTSDAPPLAMITTVESESIPLAGPTESGFTIVASRGAAGARTLVSPDVATCRACLTEMLDPGDRRFRHAFITCTDCGPRFTIIRDLPYDRPATTMAAFPMCAACAREYEDPADRRFHAQPVACLDCGPALWFESGTSRVSGTDDALVAAQTALRDGLIVAIKGPGGFHLACAADSPAAIVGLRARKARNQKPFALMARDVSVVQELVHMDDAEQRTLCGPARPTNRCASTTPTSQPGCRARLTEEVMG